MPQQSERFRQMLIDFAKQIGKPDPEVYVDDGKWKARQGGNGVDYAKKTAVSFEIRRHPVRTANCRNSFVFSACPNMPRIKDTI